LHAILLHVGVYTGAARLCLSFSVFHSTVRKTKPPDKFGNIALDRVREIHQNMEQRGWPFQETGDDRQIAAYPCTVARQASALLTAHTPPAQGSSALHVGLPTVWQMTPQPVRSQADAARFLPALPLRWPIFVNRQLIESDNGWRDLPTTALSGKTHFSF
jgi:hypothetical protein